MIPKPTAIPLNQVDIKSLQSAAQYYLDEIEAGVYKEDSDDMQHMWEAMMIAFFGPDVFKWTNQETP